MSQTLAGSRWTRIGMLAISLTALGLGASTSLAVPLWDGMTASIYATAANPFEIGFDTDGTLYAAHNSPTNSAAFIYQIPPGGGTALEWGSTAPDDPDGIHVFGGHVYASNEGTIWQYTTPDGAGSVLATVAGSPNQTTITIDEAGDYFSAGSVVVGNAAFGTDIHVIEPGMAPLSFVSSASFNIPRALQFVEGTLYLTETEANKGVWSVDSTGTLTQIADGSFSWQRPDAMVYEPGTDTFLIGDLSQLLRLPRSGGLVQVVGTGFDVISGLTFNSQGQLLIADQGNGVVWQIIADGDFNGDGNWDCLDINALSSAIAAGSTDLVFDMNGDDLITRADITAADVGWLAVGGAQNVAQTGGNPFLEGDSDLNGIVDGSDFGIWNANKFSSNSNYCQGDWNASGVVDGSDFGIWNGHKFQSSSGVSAVPEPAWAAWCLTTLLLSVHVFRFKATSVENSVKN